MSPEPEVESLASQHPLLPQTEREAKRYLFELLKAANWLDALSRAHLLLEHESKYRSLVAALQAHEWDGIDYNQCPACDQPQSGGHTSECWLAALVQEPR